MEFNSPEGLASVYGDYNPTTYYLGDQSVNESMARDRESTNQSVQKTAQDTLKTQFDTANNPQKLEYQRLQNEGLGYDNVDKGVKSRINAATESAQLSNAQLKQVLEADEGQIKQMQSQAQMMAYNPDPAIQAKGTRLMQMSAVAVEARQKHKDEMEKQDLIRKSAERVGAGHDAASRYATDSRGAIAASRQKVAGSVEQQIAGAKGSEQHIGIYESAARTAMMGGDNELANYYANMAERTRTGRLQEKSVGAVIGNNAKPDLAPLGIKPNSTPPPVTAVSPMPGIAPPQAAPAAPPPSAVPDGAIKMLQKNPTMAAQFDLKYGSGASRQFLGK